VDGIGTLRILEAVRILGLEKKTRIYQASTSELFGGLAENKNEKGYYDEHSPFYPRSPYGVAKIYGFWITKNYREAYNIFACNGILFNHESPRRGETFVTRKITMATAAIALGQQDCLYLGNLDAQRDWGHAKDYVEAMWRILQQDVAEDYVIAMGETTHVREFVRMAFLVLGIEIEFIGHGVDEKGYVKACNNLDFQIKLGKQVIAVDPKYFRPTEVEVLIGDPTKSKRQLRWVPKYNLAGLIKEMVESDLQVLRKEIVLRNNGYNTANSVNL
jgi:GDPmannose 4,6-dehydratase